jgi:hypothetical protein
MKFNIWTWDDEIEMSGQSCTYNGHIYTQEKRKSKLFIFTLLEHIVEAQCLQEPCQLHFQN